MLVDIEKLGKKYKAIVPDGSPKENWNYGIIVGPPDFDWLPPELEVRLHNELFVRGIIEKKDALRASGSLQGALMAALGLDVQTILQAYELDGANKT